MSPPAPEIPLSPRQSVLISRLQVICDRAATKPLPVNIEEIWGFGSLFRAKERPGDLDLLMMHSSRNPIYEIFTNLMKKAREYHNEFESPLKALSHVIETDGEDAIKELLPIFSDWLEGYTWKKIYGEFIPELSYSWERVTIQVLKRSLPRVTILLANLGDKVHLKAESRVLLWSKTKPDLYYHIAQAFDPSKVRIGITIELENFDEQIHTGNMEADVIKRLFLELRGETRSEDPQGLDKWLVERALHLFELPKESISQIIHNIHMMFPENPNIPFNFIDEYKETPLESLKEIVEKKRDEVDEARWRLEVFRTALRELIRWKGERLYEKEWFSTWPMDAWIAKETLQNIPKDTVSEGKIRENLRQLALPEHKILAEKGYGKTTYTLPENAEEEAKIKGENIRTEIERKYVNRLRPEVKAVNKAFSLQIELNGNRTPKLAKVWYHYSAWDIKETPATVQSIIDWCREHGFEIERKYHTIYAELIIPLEQCKDVKEMKNKIRKLLA